MKKFAWLVAVIALGAQADVYKWTDKDGQVHYGEQPPPDADTKKINVPTGGPESPPSDASKAPSDKDKLKAAPADKSGPNKTPTDKDDRCKYEKEQLDVISKGGAINYWNDEKKLVPLTPEKREAAKAQVQDNIKRYCS